MHTDEVSYIRHLDLQAIDDNFPKEEYREGQKKCIEFIANSFNAGKKIVIIEVPTGGGKSAIGMTMANMVKDSYYLTITKILQDQLTRDFDDIVELKGRNSYPCTFYDRFGDKLIKTKALSQADLNSKLLEKPNCTEGYCRTIQGIGQKRLSCTSCFKRDPAQVNGNNLPSGDLIQLTSGKYSDCPYYEQVYQAIAAKKVVMNFSSFLYQTSLTTRFSNKRDLLIIDEGHNIEPQLLEFVSFTISDSMLQEHNIFIPELDTAIDYAKWFQQIRMESILKQLIEVNERAKNVKMIDDYERLLKKYMMFMEHLSERGSEWVVEYTAHNLHNKNYRSITLKPVYAIDFAEKLLFKYGKRILIMSATILDIDVMCKSLGLDKSTVASYRMKNRFPVDNRPIYLTPAARMSGGKNKMHEWAPKLVSKVNEICDKYKNVRGIVHTHNFAILNAILDTCKPQIRRRFITQNDYPDKSELLQAHAIKSDSIILAPAMHEGIDLKDDLSRFQIICKVPYANFYENKQLARRVELDPKYYTWLTALKLVQSYGRSIRSESDYADTFIIDEMIYKFIKDAKSMLPSWFLEAIIDKG